MLPLSARSAEALVELAQRYGSWLTNNPDADIAEVCRTAGRGSLALRAPRRTGGGFGAERERGSRRPGRGRLRPGVVRGECTDRPTTAWLFTGQGSQYPGMARELFAAEPVFAETVKRCADAVSEILPQPLLEVIFATDRETGGKAGETLKHTSFAQPALFAIEMGLARLWQSWGIEPDVVLGHSVGQYAAACVAGVFSLEDGARLMAERGRLFGSLPAGGRMVAVFADPKLVEQVAGEFPQVSVGAYNGPNTVLSGPGEDLEQVVAKFSEDGVRCTWLETSHAFHSELLEPVLGEFESFASQFEFAVPTLPLVCNRTGAILTAETPLDAQYWRRHSRQPVQFAESVRTVAALGCAVLMEIGPQPVLTGAAVQVWPEHLAAPRAIVSLRKGVGDRRQIADASGQGLRQRTSAQRSLRCNTGRGRKAGTAHLSVPAPSLLAEELGASPSTVLRCPDSWAAQRISLPATPSTPAGCRSSRNRGCPTTSSTAPSSFPARRMPRWLWPPSVRRRTSKRSSSTSRSSCRRRLLVRCS